MGRDLLEVGHDGGVARSGVGTEPGGVAGRRGGVRVGIAVRVRRVGVAGRRGRRELGLTSARAAAVCRAAAEGRLGRTSNCELAVDLGNVALLNARADLNGLAGGIDVVEEVGRLDAVRASARRGEVVGGAD